MNEHQNFADGQVSEYLMHLEHIRRVSHKTLSAYRQDLDKLLDFCRTRACPLIQFNRNHARRFVAELMNSGLSEASINRVLSGVRGFYRWSVRHEYCSSNPFQDIQSLKGGMRLPTVMTPEEVASIIDAAGNDFTGIRDRVIFELLYATGCRLSELTGMNTADIQLQERRILVHGKGGKDRYVFLTPSAASALSDYLPLRNRRIDKAKLSSRDRKALVINERGGRLTSQGVHHILNGYTTRLGIQKHITPHTFRHTFATHILDNDAGIRVVQELLGHEHISTTQIYSHVSAARLKEVYRKSHPHG